MRIAAFLYVLMVSQAAMAMDGPAAEASQPSWAALQTGRCMDALAAAEIRRGTMPGLMAAIARAESGRPVPPLPGVQPWPWAVNADGAALYFDSKPAAVTWVRLALQRGVRQIDVGCMQINLQSHPNAFASVDDAFEPSSNADYAARFLIRLKADAAGDWAVATGWYHSRTPVLAADYRERVAAIAAGRMPALSLGVPLYVRAIRQGALRIPLAGGGILKINLARQPSARGRARPSACRVATVLGSFMARSARDACATGRVGSAAREAGTPG